MKNPGRRVALTALFAALLSLLAAPALSADDIARYEVSGRFDDVQENVVSAIEGRGLVVNATSRVGEMLERTGRDLGASRRLYENAVVLEFCSASVSRKVMEADADLIAYCPYTIAIYALAGAPDKVFVSYRRSPAGRPAMAQVEQMLEAIVKDAIR